MYLYSAFPPPWALRTVTLFIFLNGLLICSKIGKMLIETHSSLLTFYTVICGSEVYYSLSTFTI